MDGTVSTADQVRVAREWLSFLYTMESFVRGSDGRYRASSEKWNLVVDHSTRLLAVLALTGRDENSRSGPSRWLLEIGWSVVDLLSFGIEVFVRENLDEAEVRRERLTSDRDPWLEALRLLLSREDEMIQLLATLGPFAPLGEEVDDLDKLAGSMNPLGAASTQRPGSANQEIASRYHAYSNGGREEFWSTIFEDWRSYAYRRLPELIGRGEEGTPPLLASIAALDSMADDRAWSYYVAIADFFRGGPPILPEDEEGGEEV